ncbi:MAG TPA: GAF domain-containing protein [Frankiaceae bacterium]|jgi:transcriptional regulator of acetoin/glycerol metabolism|nr:GAF domain-containing protein [Frankiaceae bacterium]
MARAANATARTVAVARESFLATGRVPGAIRPEVAQSWRRSAAHGVVDRAMAPVELTDDSLLSYRDNHPLSLAMPVIRKLLVAHALEDELLVAVGDASGRLLWVEGQAKLRRQAEGMHFVEGAQWDEAHAGTNAPGVALATSKASRISAAEHFQQAVQRWSCSAVPVYSPMGQPLGVIDVTGDERAAQPTMLALVQATAAAVEAELRLRFADGTAPPLPPLGITTGLQLDVLGRDEARLTLCSDAVAVSPRHGELLLILAAEPQGLSADEIAVRLDERPLDPVTVRAELSRLRRIVGLERIQSRPYRLAGKITTDAGRVRQLLDRGAHRAALHAYSGPILPRSNAPSVVRMRRELHAEVRDALLRHPDPELLAGWTESAAGRDDLDAWRVLHACLPQGSGRGQRAGVHARLLDAEMRT